MDSLEKGIGENEGKLCFFFKYFDFFFIFKFVKNFEICCKVFIVNENKCNDNVELFCEVIEFCDEVVCLFGYFDYVIFCIEDKMVKMIKIVFDFLNDFKECFGFGGFKEIEYFKELKKKDYEECGFLYDGNYYFWDYCYYDCLMIEKEYSIDENVIVEYFLIIFIIEGMFKIFEMFFGFVFN